MSVYSNISKRIGWTEQHLSFPSLQAVQELRSRVSEGDARAFEQIFKYHRFLPSAATALEREIQNELWEAFNEGCKIFK